MGIETSLPADSILTTQLQRVINWARRSSVWPLPFATACCGIELMATAASRFDLARFGAEVVRFSPRQADLLIVAGRVSVKMLPVLQRIYMQMAEPKWVVSMGACASTGGVFDTYAVVQGIECSSRHISLWDFAATTQFSLHHYSLQGFSVPQGS